jgi:hypothetical protein
MELAGRTLDLSDIKIPVYNLATKEDHIAPARSVFVGSGLFGGKVEYVLIRLQMQPLWCLSHLRHQKRRSRSMM